MQFVVTGQAPITPSLVFLSHSHNVVSVNTEQLGPHLLIMGVPSPEHFATTVPKGSA